MAGNLGSLIVHLGADTASLQSDLGRANAIVNREVMKISRAFAGVAGTLGVGIGVGAFTQWIKGALDAQDEASKLAQKIGIATESVAGLTLAAKQSGIEAQAFQSSMVKLAKSASDAATGAKAQSVAFSSIGVSVKDANGQLKGTEQLLGEVADKFASYGDSAQKTALATEFFGRAGAALIPMLNGGKKALEEYKDMAEDFGLTIGSKVAKDSERFNDSLEQLSFVSKGVANQIASSLAPALADVTEKAVKFFRSDDWKAWLTSISNAAKVVANNLGAIISGVKLIGQLALLNIGKNMVQSLTLAAAKLIFIQIQTKAATAAAIEMGIAFDVASKKTQAGIMDSVKSIGLIKIAFGSVFAAVTGWQIGTYLRKEFRIVADAGDYLVYGIAQGWEELKRSSKIIWEEIKFVAVGSIDVIIEAFAGMIRGLASAADIQVMGKSIFGNTSQELGALADNLSSVLTPVDNFKSALSGIQAEYTKNSAGNKAMLEDMQSATSATFDAGDSANAAALAFGKLGEGAGDTAPGLGDAAAGAKEAADKLKALAEAQREFAAGNLQLAADLVGPLAQAQEQYRSDLTEAAQAVLDGKASMDDYIVRQQLLASQLAVTSAELEKQGDVLGSVSADNADALDMVGMVGRQRAIKEAVKGATAEYLKNAKAGHVMADALEFVQAGAEAGAGTLYDATQQASQLENILSQFDNLDFGSSFVDQIKKVGEELKKATDPEQVERLSRALEELRKKQIVANTSAFLDLGQAIVGGMKESAEEGSRTMAALQIASAGLAMAQGILAILTQGQGDPYSAFARMAAMAALVIPLAAQVGGAISMASGAGFSDTAAQRQASQGTGTVLGDAEAKSESIANAIEITADATTTLVGLNRGMLNALQALQKGLSGAGGLLARGAGEADFSGMDLAVDGAGSGLFDGKGLLGRLLTGSSKITDQGIIIMGGALNDMLESIAVGAYQEVQSRSWAFGSTQTNEGIVDVSDQFGKQFSLVMQSIADTVREGALALGLLPADIEAAMAAYQVETIRISLKDLSAEEQQAELEAVFSSIFDGLAGAVVPFIEQFQQVGEGLGETLVRVATEVQVAQEAFRQLGLSVNETDPERFAQISDSLIAAAGGLEDFIAGMQSFVANFSTDAYQFTVASEALASAFSQVGLAVPDTREEMWALMQTLDATTEAGQEQIATLLRLAGVADEYYSLLDEQAEAFNNIGGDVEKFREAISQIASQMQASIKHANDLARANGAEGASTEELTQIHSRAATLFAKVLGQLRQAAQELAFSMGLTDIGGAGQIDAEIARLEGMAGSATQPIRDFGDAMQTAAQQASDAINLLLGDLSNLNDQEKLQKALEGLRAGTVSQEQVLEIGRRLYASTQQYNDLFAMVRQYGRPAAGTSGGGGSSGASDSGGMSSADRERLAALYEQRDAAMGRQDYLNAQTLASQIAEISEASGDDYMQVIEEMGVDAAELAERLHLDNVEQLDQLIERYQEATDSAGQNTTILADLLRDILATLRGETVTSSDHAARGNPMAGTRSRDEAEMVGEVIARHITRAQMNGLGSRNERGVTRAR